MSGFAKCSRMLGPWVMTQCEAPSHEKILSPGVTTTATGSLTGLGVLSNMVTPQLGARTPEPDAGPSREARLSGWRPPPSPDVVILTPPGDDGSGCPQTRFLPLSFFSMKKHTVQSPLLLAFYNSDAT